MIGALGATTPLQHVGLPDPTVAAARLEGLDIAALRRAADHLATLAVALAGASADGSDAVAQISRGWSAPEPALGITRLLRCANHTAQVLHGHSAALDAASVTLQHEQSGGRHDVMVATARINVLRTSWLETAGALLGAPSLTAEFGILTIIERLHQLLSARLRVVDMALAALTQQLAADPTVEPDGLRGGPDALLPPDPVNNPAHRTDMNNRAALDADLRSGDPNRVQFASSITQSLRHAGQRGGTAQLVVYDATAFDGQGRAAIAVGDLTTATNVAVVVPGIANSPSAMSGGIDLAADLRDEAARQDPADPTAVVAWYGYDIPGSWTKDPGSTIGRDVLDTLAAGSATHAASGAPLLAADLTALKGMAQSSARMTALGFSMGATTVSEAGRFPLPVESMVLLGAPGAGWDTTTAAGYASVPPSGVYSLSYDQDPVTQPITDVLAWRAEGIPDPFGVDPAAEAFGGNHIDATTNVPIITGAGWLSRITHFTGDLRHHNMRNYMQGPALTAEGAIVVGHGGTVPRKRGRR